MKGSKAISGRVKRCGRVLTRSSRVLGGYVGEDGLVEIEGPEM